MLLNATGHLKIGLIVDVPGWAFENIANRIVDQIKDQVDIEIVYMSNFSQESKLYTYLFAGPKKYDLIHFFWRDSISKLFSAHAVLEAVSQMNKADAEQLFDNIIKTKKTTWICDHLFLDDSPNSSWRLRTLGYTDGYVVSSSILESIYTRLNGIQAPAAVIQDGVDLKLFNPGTGCPSQISDDDVEIKIGWAGNSAWGPENRDHKGLTSIIVPAIEKLRSEGNPVVACFQDRKEKWVARKEMPKFYSQIHIYLCASLSEGTPNPILEAMACGVPVLSTDVGIVREALGPQQQEFIVKDRHSDEFITKLRRLAVDRKLRTRLSRENLDSIKAWDWIDRVKPWVDFLINTARSSRIPGLEQRQFNSLQEALILARMSRNQQLPVTTDNDRLQFTASPRMPPKGFN